MSLHAPPLPTPRPSPQLHPRRFLRLQGRTRPHRHLRRPGAKSKVNKAMVNLRRRLAPSLTTEASRPVFTYFGCGGFAFILIYLFLVGFLVFLLFLGCLLLLGPGSCFSSVIRIKSTVCPCRARTLLQKGPTSCWAQACRSSWSHPSVRPLAGVRSKIET